MNITITERHCVICNNILSVSNTSNRCRRHVLEEGKRPLFKVITPTKVCTKKSVCAEINTPEKVLETIASFYEVSQQDILGKSRQKRLVWARQILMYLLRTELKMSLLKIASFLNRDHTTIMHGCEQVAQRIKMNPVLVKTIEAIRSEISI